MVCVQYESTAAWLLRFWHGFALRMPKHVCKGRFSHWFLRWCAKLQCTQHWDLRWACTKVLAGSMMSGEFCGSATVKSVDCLHLLQYHATAIWPQERMVLWSTTWQQPFVAGFLLDVRRR